MGGLFYYPSIYYMMQSTYTFASVLLQWFANNGRDLPWRQTRDPYLIWVSEIILQQTRVVQGTDYYCRFVKRFPTVEALAMAELDEVMTYWEGLGYYSRARNLHTAARQVVELGAFPTDYKGIRALKGVGDYTAAAIASFAYGLPHAVVDGNVYRVLSRYYGIDIPIDSTEGKRHFAELAQAILAKNAPALYNQAIMDFGALQCVPKSPACSACPLSETCSAWSVGRVEQLPVKAKKTAVKERFLAYMIILEESSIYIHRREEGDIWKGLYEPLLVETPQKAEAAEVVPKGYRLLAVVEGLKHQLTHRLIHADAYLIEKESSARGTALIKEYQKVAIADLANYAAPRLVNIIYERLLSRKTK